MSVPSVADHYARHLAEVYAWMVGGHEAAIARGETELDGLGIANAGRGRALDLGAGFGTHTIPLARRGYDVTAVDGSALLLEQLRSLDPSERIHTVEGDLLEALEDSEPGLQLVLCMGDTLTHLDDEGAAETLVRLAAERLAPGGRLLLTFRDYSTMTEGEVRSFTVRTSEEREARCTLTREGDRVRVQDHLRERKGTGWVVRASSYRKLCLSPDAVASQLERVGLRCARSSGSMLAIVGTREAETKA
ncbi:MAG: class I SAM-dependent methyltransferase [Deltaproteobacteria bacterium]|nr:class I SAM-dependent methyltransferase [Deltaproteobacteria bacterium]